jgi:hypothetical protein
VVVGARADVRLDPVREKRGRWRERQGERGWKDGTAA